MAYTEAGKRASIKYIKTNYDRLEIKIPKGRREALKALTEKRGDSINGIVNAYLREYMSLTETEWNAQPQEMQEENENA